MVKISGPEGWSFEPTQVRSPHCLLKPDLQQNIFQSIEENPQCNMYLLLSFKLTSCTLATFIGESCVI